MKPPQEVEDLVRKTLGARCLELPHIVFGAKLEQTKVQVYNRCSKQSNTVRFWNPWKKCHTKDYWAYYYEDVRVVSVKA